MAAGAVILLLREEGLWAAEPATDLTTRELRGAPACWGGRQRGGCGRQGHLPLVECDGSEAGSLLTA